jgi:hypothetical protein
MREFISLHLASAAVLRFRGALQPLRLYRIVTGQAPAIVVAIDPLKRSFNLRHFRAIPIIQPIEQRDPVFVGGLVEPVSVALDLLLFLVKVLQGRQQLRSALGEPVEMFSASDLVHAFPLELEK